MVITHNIPALNARRHLGINSSQTAGNLEKLSSGYKINRAADDAGGLGISEKMRAQIGGLNKAEDNISNAIDLIATAEGAMQEMHAMVQRMHEIAVQATNGTYQDDIDRQAANLEFQELKNAFDSIVDYTNYNGIKLLSGNPYPGMTWGATYSMSDFADGAQNITIGTNSANVNSVDLTFVYDADGKIDFIRDETGTYSVDLKNSSAPNADGTVTVVMTDMADNTKTFEFTIDGDWNKASPVPHVNEVNLKFSFDPNDTTKLKSLNVGTDSWDPAKGEFAKYTNTWDDIAGGTASIPTTGDFATVTGFSGDVEWIINFLDDGSGAIDMNNCYIKIGEDKYRLTDDTGNLKVTVGGNTFEYTPSSFALDTASVVGENVSVSFVTKYTNGSVGATTDITFGQTTANDIIDPDYVWRGNYMPGAFTDILFQIGANGTRDQQTTLKIQDMHPTQLGTNTNFDGVTAVDAGYVLNGTDHAVYNIRNAADVENLSVAALHVLDKNAANISIEVLTKAINDISLVRGEFGAQQNRLEYALNNLGVTKENLISAESTIRDTDMATEMTDFTKNNILIQAAQAMLAQANSLPQGVLNLLQ